MLFRNRTTDELIRQRDERLDAVRSKRVTGRRAEENKKAITEITEELRRRGQ
jgi:hypothetical protein